METNQNQPVQVPGAANNGSDFSQKPQHNKTLVAVIAVLGVAVLGLAGALVMGRSDNQSGGSYGLAPVENQVASSQYVAKPLPVPAPAPASTRSNLASVGNTAEKAPARTVVAQNQPVQRRSEVCSSCGRVEEVTAVQRQGAVNGVPVGNTTIGLGTVAGGLVGGLLGNQVGGGNGKTAATVLGVAGGAFAGNTIEKNMKKVTVYQVRVRMDDGTSRLMDVSSSIPVGSRVVVEGKNLRLA